MGVKKNDERGKRKEVEEKKKEEEEDNSISILSPAPETTRWAESQPREQQKVDDVTRKATVKKKEN